jgi:hypothetical protein
MKKPHFFTALILIFTALISCSSDSSSSTNDPVAGQWKLVNVTGTFGGINNNFPLGMITWNFNPNNQTVTVVNNNTNPNLWDVLETGVYDYQYINNPESPCGESIEIDGSVFGCYTIENDSLVIDQSIADGFAITLKH